MEKAKPGKAYPLGATWDGKGVNFSIFSENAKKIEILFFDSPEDKNARAVIELPERTTYVWHSYFSGIGPGQLYNFRVYGPYEPGSGHRFNASKLLLDPYAKAYSGNLKWSDNLFGYKIGDEKQDLSFDDRESAEFLPKSVVVDPSFDWEKDKPLRIPWNKTIIYETHVKGITALHDQVPSDKRGTYSGLSSPIIIEHLKKLGVTAVELMPVHQHIDEKNLVEKGLKNYWGYNTIGFFAPDSRYSSFGDRGGQVKEFKEMVKTLHKAGIEVILDVVYNHTAEGNHFGPTLCFKGIDNISYYNLVKDDLRYYMDFSGCGNCFNMAHPWALKLIMDSLRYWVVEMHVDGFRFDLASSLAREFLEVDKLSAFFDIIQQDPVLSMVKLVAEPWDLGPAGYQVGNFPPGWAEWNNRYRDTMRSFWKGDEHQIADFAYRLSGSSDIYQWDRRKPQESINFITAHDGFTLADLVSYNQKHNEQNKEENKDGSDNNLSWNCGQEGPSKDKTVRELRQRQMRNFLATLLLSHGTPMILGGDEIGRTQSGNNNTYAQDNPTSWYDWKLDDEKNSLLEFTAFLIHIRKKHPIFRRKKFFQGKIGADSLDIAWLDANGNEMKGEQWKQSFIKSLGAMLGGDAIDDEDEDGNLLKDDNFLILFNAHSDVVPFTLGQLSNKKWEIVLDTYTADFPRQGAKALETDKLELKPFSLMLLKQVI